MFNSIVLMVGEASSGMDLSVLTQLWTQAKGMITDVISIVSSHPLLVCMLIALPLVGLGVGLFKRLVS